MKTHSKGEHICIKAVLKEQKIVLTTKHFLTDNPADSTSTFTRKTERVGSRLTGEKAEEEASIKSERINSVKVVCNSNRYSFVVVPSLFLKL